MYSIISYDDVLSCTNYLNDIRITRVTGNTAVGSAALGSVVAHILATLPLWSPAAIFMPWEWKERGSDLAVQTRNPRFAVANAPKLGNTLGISGAGTPNHFASVAPYCSIDVVGIHWPSSPASSAPPMARLGKRP